MTVGEAVLAVMLYEGILDVRDSDDVDLSSALQRMRKICKAIKVLFLLAAVFFSGVWLIFVVSILGDWLRTGQDAASLLLYAIVYGVLVILILWNLSQLFAEVDKGEPPFSELQADRLQTIAIVSLTIVGLDVLLSFGFMFQPIPELGFGMVVNDGITEPTLNLNVGMLAFSAIMYSLSAIFRYAALLQQLSDETV